MKNKLRVQNASIYKKAFEAGLSLCGVEDGQPQWIGTKVQFANAQ